MPFKRSRVVLTPGEQLPYKVVIEHEGGSTEYAVATVRDGEAIIRRSLPRSLPPELDALRESPVEAAPSIDQAEAS